MILAQGGDICDTRIQVTEPYGVSYSLVLFLDRFVVLAIRTGSTDALGGSVNQRFSRFASDRIHVIAGVNLPLAMTVALARPDEKLDFDALVDEARQQIVYVNGVSSAECEDDE